MLGLAWEDASDLQEKCEEKKDLDAQTILLARELQGNPKRILGQLEAGFSFNKSFFRKKNAINNFQVHLQYWDINILVDRLTEEIHELVNANVADTQVADLHRSTDEVGTVDIEQLSRLYKREVGVVFPQLVQRRLTDVEEFHRQVVRNRKDFLAAEIERLERLERRVATRNQQIEEKSRSRALNMDVLKTHGALSEYNRIQRLFLDAQANLNLLETQIANIRGLEQRKDQFRIELE